MLRKSESIEELVESVESTAAELALRLTEVEVHSADLGLDGLRAWSEAFVDTLLPLRVAWLGNARRRSDADLTLNGSWLLSDGESSWLVKADGQDSVIGEVAAQRSAYSRITGTRRDLLALLLGRPAQVECVGLPELVNGFKAAFPGP